MAAKESTVRADENALKKIESAKEFDELYSMDALKISEMSSGEQTPTAPSSNRMVAGSTFLRAVSEDGRAQPQPHSFSECNSSSFSLRIGPNYAKNGNKAPAGPSLYEAIGAE